MIKVLYDTKKNTRCLEKILYTNDMEYAMKKIFEMNQEAGYQKYYGVRVVKDIRGYEIEDAI